MNDEETKEQMSIIEQEDPALFEELSMRRKWSYVAKDPNKGAKDDLLHKSSYWGMLNHLPEKGVSRIVTDKILDMDKVSCDRILRGILDEKLADDSARSRQQRNRQELRSKLNRRHEMTMQLEARCGVRLGLSQKSR